jgi:hypothetical protein
MPRTAIRLARTAGKISKDIGQFSQEQQELLVYKQRQEYQEQQEALAGAT